MGELETKGFVDSEGEIGAFGFMRELGNVARIQRLAKQQGFLGESRWCRAEVVRHFSLTLSQTLRAMGFTASLSLVNLSTWIPGIRILEG